MSLLCQFWVISVCAWLLFCAEDILYVLFLCCRCSGNPSHTSQQVCVGVLFILDFLLATCCLATTWSAFTARLSGIPLCKGKCASSHRVQLSSCKKLLDVLLLKNQAMDIFVIFVFMMVCDCFVTGMCSLTALNLVCEWFVTGNVQPYSSELLQAMRSAIHKIHSGRICCCWWNLCLRQLHKCCVQRWLPFHFAL